MKGRQGKVRVGQFNSIQGKAMVGQNKTNLGQDKDRIMEGKGKASEEQDKYQRHIIKDIAKA